MTIESDILVICASWEDRFLLGLDRILNDRLFKTAVILYSDEYADRTHEVRAKADLVCRNHGVAPTPGIIFGGEPNRTWQDTLLPLLKEIPEGTRAVVDISTMPREIIWHSFWFLELRRSVVEFVYNRPQGYGDWLSRDPESPRLVYKMSGISKLAARTALLVLGGYDEDRVKHLIERFEPTVTLLGLQKESLDPKNDERMRALENAFCGDSSVVQFRLDSYCADFGMADISTAIHPFQGKYNLVMASMGPKLSAGALYRLQRTNDEFGLVYLPSGEFNSAYSHGIGESIWGTLNF